MKKFLSIIAILITGVVSAQVPAYNPDGYKTPLIYHEGKTTTELDALTLGANDRVIAYDSTLGRYREWDGTAWGDFGGLLQEVSNPMNSIYGSKLQALNASDGFYTVSTANKYIGHLINISGATGTNAYGGVFIENNATPFIDETALIHYGTNYSETYLQNTGGLYTSGGLTITAAKNTSYIDFYLGNTATADNPLSGLDNVFSLKANREITFPQLTNTIIDGEATGRIPTTRSWIEAQNFGDITSSSSIADHTIVRGDGGAKGVQQSNVQIDDSDNMFGITSLIVSGNASANTFNSVSLSTSGGSLNLGTVKLSGGLSETSIGVNAGYRGSNNSVSIGANSGQYIYAGASSTSVGNYSSNKNTGNSTSNFGNNSSLLNTGDFTLGLGAKSLYVNQGDNNTAIGYEAFYDFKDNVAGAVNIVDSTTDIDIALERITITAHGLGATNDYVTLKYTTTGTPIGGLTTTASVNFYILKVIDANTLEFYGTDITSIGTDVHTFTPQFTYSNSTALGANSEPLASNQIMLGDTNITKVTVGNTSYSPTADNDVATKKYVDDNGGGSSQLSDLSDVNTSTPTDKNVLIADGVDWESRPLLESDISDFGTYATLGVNTFTDKQTINSSIPVTALEVNHTSTSPGIVSDTGATGTGDNFRGQNNGSVTFSVSRTGDVTANTYNGVALTDAGALTDFLNATGSYSSPIIDDIYGSSWNGDNDNGASRNTIYDKIESIIAGSGATASTETKSDWDGVADTWVVTVAPAVGHQIYEGSAYLVEGTHYTISGSTITFTNPPTASVTTTYYPNVVVPVGIDTTDDLTEGSTNLYYTEARVSANSSVTANTAKITNATHTGEVTGSGVLTVDPTAVSNKTLKSSLSGTEEVLINDSGTLKKTTAQDIVDLGGGSSIYQTATLTINDPVIGSSQSIISAQGTNKVIFVHGIEYIYKDLPATTASVTCTLTYAGDGATMCSHSAKGVPAQTLKTGAIDQDDSEERTGTTMVNSAVNYNIDGTAETMTGGTMYVKVYYTVADTSTGF